MSVKGRFGYTDDPTTTDPLGSAGEPTETKKGPTGHYDGKEERKEGRTSVPRSLRWGRENPKVPRSTRFGVQEATTVSGKVKIVPCSVVFHQKSFLDNPFPTDPNVEGKKRGSN